MSHRKGSKRGERRELEGSGKSERKAVEVAPKPHKEPERRN